MQSAGRVSGGEWGGTIPKVPPFRNKDRVELLKLNPYLPGLLLLVTHKCSGKKFKEGWRQLRRR